MYQKNKINFAFVVSSVNIFLHSWSKLRRARVTLCEKLSTQFSVDNESVITKA